MVFERLDPRIRAVLKEKNIHEPTGPQRDAIPKILEGRHVLLVAPTGIGKTEAAMLPVIHKMLTAPGKGIQCLYITPLRALNRDMLKRLEEFGDALDINVAVRHGDTSQSERQRQSKQAPDILITTPETLQVMFTGRNLRAHLANVRYVVVDEIHELTDDERGAQLAIALERLVDLAGEFQRIGLSATVGSVSTVAGYLGGAEREVDVVRAQVSKQMSLSVQCPEVTDADRDLAGTLQSDPQLVSCMRRCREIIDSHRSTLLFVNTRDTAEALAARYHIWDEDFKVGVHHGSLSKEIRIEMEDDFKAERLKGLICTSSLELGIDIGSADFAIQYNSPRQVARLIQRMGRAGHRVGERSEGAIVASNPDEIAESLVIVRKALAEELEPMRVRENPMTVLANQLVAMAMVGQVRKHDAFVTIKRSYPFMNLEREKFDAVLTLLGSIGLLFVNENDFRRSARGRKYFYDNISMIPDERTYLVRDLGTRSVVGTLDESFVVAFAEPYATFITRGRSWRIIEVREDELLVEQVKDIGSIPSWAGEDIPVPYSVAQEVGRLRREGVTEGYSGDPQANEALRRYIQEQGSSGPIPTDKLVTIEMGKKMTIINSCFGTKVNETMAKMLSTLLSARLGESIGVTTDPYRIILDLPRDVSPEVLIDTVRSIRPSTVESLIRMVIKNSSHLRWRFVYVAKKFGAVEKDADYRNINFTRLVEAYDGTPLFDEAVDKVLWEDMDMDSTVDVVNRIWTGDLEIKVCGLTPMGRAGLQHSKELITPQRADRSILMALKKRLEDELMYMSCLNCGHQFRLRPKEAPKRILCQNCGGTMIAALSSYNKDNIRLIRKKEPTDEEKKEIARLYKSASLVSSKGKKAMMALAGRGVGPDTAARVLGSFHKDEDDLLRDILAAEINYAKTKRFWD
ncbi:MAG: DEAD/DEAH box helicase [Methanomassiliicoccales archaeon]|nr:MAG: DEAD/DEAH box helicase [Methanomassiliicoccales archaeon]